MPPPVTRTMTRIRMSVGNAWNPSITRMIDSLRLLKVESRPSPVPTTAATTVLTRARGRSASAAARVRAKTSRPELSVPKMCATLGDCSVSPVMKFGDMTSTEMPPPMRIATSIAAPMYPAIGRFLVAPRATEMAVVLVIADGPFAGEV